MPTLRRQTCKDLDVDGALIKELADCVRESEARAKLSEWLDGDIVKIRVLKRRCTLAGVGKAEIDSAANGQDPKEALIGLLAGDATGPPWKEGDPPLKDAAAEVRAELEGMKDALRRQTAGGHGTSGADKVVAFATALGAAARQRPQRLHQENEQWFLPRSLNVEAVSHNSSKGTTYYTLRCTDDELVSLRGGEPVDTARRWRELLRFHGEVLAAAKRADGKFRKAAELGVAEPKFPSTRSYLGISTKPDARLSGLQDYFAAFGEWDQAMRECGFAVTGLHSVRHFLTPIDEDTPEPEPEPQPEPEPEPEPEPTRD